MVKIGDKQLPWKSGLTVEQLIQQMNDPYRYVLVRLNGQVVSEPKFKDTHVPDQAEVVLIPMVTGG